MQKTLLIFSFFCFFILSGRLQAMDFNNNLLPGDTSKIDNHLLGKYSVITVSAGVLSDSGRIVQSEEFPDKMTVLLTPKSVKVSSKTVVEYSNLGEKEVQSEFDSDAGQRMTHFLCDGPGTELYILILTEYKGKREISVTAVNMFDMSFVSYELNPLKK